MSGCSAVNCSNSHKKGFRMFLFPRDKDRRKVWAQNMKRDKWEPKDTSRLCEMHFEESQYENRREDGWRKLKPNAIPTIFDIPNPPKRFESSRRVLHYHSGVSDSNVIMSDQTMNDNDKIYSFEDFQKLKSENDDLKAQIAKLEDGILKFLNKEQMDAAINGHKLFEKWGMPSIIKALKFRFALGVHGFEYLRKSCYPLPSYSTILRRIRKFGLSFGIFEDLLEPLQYKIDAMDPEDKFCVMSIDEMEIDGRRDFEKSQKKFYGNVTLGDPTEEKGTKVVAVLIRGIKHRWKQVIAAEVTGKSTTPEILFNFIARCIQFIESKGLCVVSLTSDMGPSNQGLWTKAGIFATKNGHRQNKFQAGNATEHKFAMPDCCHLLKNLKNAVLKGNVILPESYVTSNNLPTQNVDGKYVRALWEAETCGKKHLRFLHHLKQRDIYPDNYEKMHVGAAIRFFSGKTSSAIETAVHLKLLPKAALTTAHFIRLIEDWFGIVNSKTRKASITKRNKRSKFEYLRKITDLFQLISFTKKGWKPLNRGIILASLSIIDIAEFCFKNGFDFVLTHRFTQDALENVFSQVRRRSSKTPSSLQCIRAFRTISLSQFISDINRTCYMSDSDAFLINSFNDDNTAGSSKPSTSAPLDEELKFPTIDFKNLKLNSYDLNLLFNVCGSTTNAMLKKTICEQCTLFLNTPVSGVEYMEFYKHSLNKGGLKTPCEELLKLIINCEVIYRKCEQFLLDNPAFTLIDKIVNEIDVKFPKCSSCNLKKKVVNHFFTVRSFSLVNTDQCTNSKRKEMYGTSSNKKLKRYYMFISFS